MTKIQGPSFPDNRLTVNFTTSLKNYNIYNIKYATTTFNIICFSYAKKSCAPANILSPVN